ncbi:MAG: hypothetical protein PF568_07400 [Deltaproteobacteria bacterium]|nr:hypothetical protein [Deltaproteobacteria bacterium]
MPVTKKRKCPSVNLPSLPINEVLVDLRAALAVQPAAVLAAPPGSG